MKIYRLWSDSNHNIHYTLGYFTTKNLAEKFEENLLKTGMLI